MDPSLSETYLVRAGFWLLTTTLLYFLMNGAQLFETAVIVPRWSAAPPESLQLFYGRYGLDFKAFWITLHSVHEVTFLLAIGFCWRLAGIRNGLLVLLALHVAVRAWTLLYFAPNIIEFQQIAQSAQVLPDLPLRTVQWRNLNYVRVGVFVALSFGLLPLGYKLLHLLLRN